LFKAPADFTLEYIQEWTGFEQSECLVHLLTVQIANANSLDVSVSDLAGTTCDPSARRRLQSGGVAYDVVVGFDQQGDANEAMDQIQDTDAFHLALRGHAQSFNPDMDVRRTSSPAMFGKVVFYSSDKLL